MHEKTYFKVILKFRSLVLSHTHTHTHTHRWDMGKVRDRFGGMGRFKGGLRCKGWVTV